MKHFESEAYVEPGMIRMASDKIRKGETKTGGHYWLDKVFSENGRKSLTIFATNCDNVQMDFPAYKIVKIDCATFSGRKLPDGSFRDEATINVTIEPIYNATSFSETSALGDDELPFN